MSLESEDDGLADIEFYFECHFRLSPNPENALYKISYWAFWMVFALLAYGVYSAIFSITLGITSWILIEKWRKFRNYVFLNGIALIALLSTATYMCENIKCLNHFPFFMNDKRFVIAQMVRVLLRISMSHWLLVASLTFNIGIVKVFKNRMRPRYLVTNLLVYIAPIVEGAILFSTVYYCKYKIRHVENITLCITCLYLLASAFVYLTVMCTLVYLGIRASDSDSKRHISKRIMLSLAACIASVISSYVPMAILDLFTRSLVIKNVVYTVSVVTMVGAIMVCLSLRSHREAWRGYLRQRNVQNST